MAGSDRIEVYVARSGDLFQGWVSQPAAIGHTVVGGQLHKCAEFHKTEHEALADATRLATDLRLRAETASGA
jgi:hypothetical protein